MDKKLAKKLAGVELLAENRIATCLRAPHLPRLSDSGTDEDVFQLQGFQPQNKSEFAPQDDDYIFESFRAISARYLGARGYFLDFATEGMLEKALPLFLPKDKGGSRLDHLKLVEDHWNHINAQIAPIILASWSEKDGDLDSPGINVTAKIDWKLNPKIARGFQSRPPLYDNTSISFVGQTEQSHPDMKWIEFIFALGEERDSEIVRWIVTEVEEIRHLGLVSNGADEHAKKLPGGEMAAQLIANAENGSKQFFLNEPTTGENDMDELKLSPENLAELASVLGVEITLESADQLISLVTTAMENHDALKAELKQAKPKAKLWDEHLSAQREAVKKLLGKARDGKNNAGTERIIERLDWEELSDLEDELNDELDAKFPLKCQSCGETNLKRRSSREEPEARPEGDGQRVNAQSYRDV